MVSGVGRGLGVLDGVKIVDEKGAVLGVNVGCHCNQWTLCGVVILCREGGDAALPK